MQTVKRQFTQEFPSAFTMDDVARSCAEAGIPAYAMPDTEGFALIGIGRRMEVSREALAEWICTQPKLQEL